MPDTQLRHVVFGYGSLINPASANRTLQRPTDPAPFPTAELTGYARQWDYTTRLHATDAPPGCEARGVALNVAPEAAAFCNGVLILVEPDELARLDLREAGYNRVDVTAQTRADGPLPWPEPFTVWTYVARPERRVLPPGAFIPRHYLDIVREGLAQHGQAYADRFDQTTLPSPLPLGDAVYPNAPLSHGNKR